MSEGLAAYRYFLYHTNVTKKVFFWKGLPKRMADVSLQEELVSHPAAYAIAANCPETFKLLVDHGADLDDVTVSIFI